MKASELLLTLSLVISVASPFLVLLIWKMNQESKLMKLMTGMFQAESLRVQSLTHLIVSRDFETYAGLQSLSQQVSRPLTQTTPSQSSTSDYIPRDDITEAQRLKNFGASIGYGEALFEDDPELAEMVSEMIAGGQVEIEEGVL